MNQYNDVEIRIMNQYNNNIIVNVDEMADDEIFILYKIQHEFPRLEKIKIEKERSNSDDFFFSKIYLDYMLELPKINLYRSYRIDTTLAKYDIRYQENVSGTITESLDEYEQQVILNSQLQVKNKNLRLKTSVFKLEDKFFENTSVYSGNKLLECRREFGLIMYRIRD